MASTSSFPPPVPVAPEAPPLTMTVPAVNTIQSVRSPIWSVPTVSEGHLSVGAGVTITDSLAPLEMQVQQAQDMSLFNPPVTVGTRRVVVKQLTKQLTHTTSPVQTPAVNLAQQLASQLTPQQAQNLLLRSLAASQAQQPATAATAGFPVAAMNQGRRVARKPIMPKQQQQPGMGRGQVVSGAGSQRPLAASTAAVGATLMAGAAGMLQSLPAGPQRVVAPVAVPPASTAGVPPTLAPSLSREPQLPLPPAIDPKGAGSTQPGVTTSKPRKPCNCKNSQCLKLYCDCFANGEFCREGCHCQNCKNNIQHTEDRARAVKTCLDRNPHAFRPKVGQKRAGDERRHIKGCNCKRSGCLKNYCECYEAKIPCSGLCRCVGCKNLADKPENKSLMQLADAADIRTQQQKAATSHFLEQLDLSASKPQPTTHDGRRLPFSFITKEVAKATCLCLLEEASHAAMNGQGAADVERVVLEEFGRCMRQIINSTQTANETGLGRPMAVR